MSRGYNIVKLKKLCEEKNLFAFFIQLKKNKNLLDLLEKNGRIESKFIKKF